jgi:hypothetical protein
MDRFDDVRKAVDLMRTGRSVWLRAAVALELGPDSSVRRSRVTVMAQNADNSSKE